MRWFGWWRAAPAVEAPKPAPAAVAPKRKGLSVGALAAAVLGRAVGLRAKPAAADSLFAPWQPPPGVLPPGHAMAMDAAFAPSIADFLAAGAFDNGARFLGYPQLAELAQLPEYRNMCEITAQEMTRKWIRIVAADGAKDKTDKIKEITNDFREFNVREVFHKAALLDQQYGRGQIFIDLGNGEEWDELQKPLPLLPEKIAKGSLQGFRVIEPIWTVPAAYNTSNPLARDFYKPTSWFVLGRPIHSDRLMTLVSREVPDILKPAYAFGGLSLVQMARPYVDDFLRTRRSVSDLLHSFTVWVLKTNLVSFLEGGDSATGSDEDRRLQAFNIMRDNRGLMVVDKDAEDLSNISTPLGGLDHLAAQSQERQASVSRVPFVKLFGITPSGLNASSDGEIRAFYDTTHGRQELLFTAPLTRVLKVVQLSRYGEIDPDIGFEFVPLWQLDEQASAARRKTDADTDAVYVDAGILSPEDVRAKVSADKDSPYHGINPNDVPEPPEPGQMTPGGEPDGGEQVPGGGGTGAQDKAEFNEADHPRKDDGRFGSGGGGSAAKGEGAGSSAGKRGALQATKVVDGKRVQADGSALPDHVVKLKIPPGWSDVRFSADPKADLLAVGKDSKGRVQSVYSQAFADTNAAAKFDRIHELMGKFGEISEQNIDAQRSSNAKVKDSADCLSLIMKMGVRPGSETDTGAKVKAYGATTLEGQHVVKDGDKVSLRFVGKKGVSLDLPVNDPDLAAMLVARSKSAGASGKLFPATNDKALLDHVHGLDGGGFKTKDFRTHVGTSTAYELVKQKPAPTTEKDYKKAVMEVAKEVSQRLGNTPTIALQSYISPTVFAEWRAGI
jgi:phage-related protein (TIGR01555 family)